MATGMRSQEAGFDSNGKGTAPPRNQAEAAVRLAEQYRHLIAQDQIVELRALKVRRGNGRPHTEAGFFDFEHLDKMAQDALEITKFAKGIYFTLNPLNPDLLSAEGAIASTGQRKGNWPKTRMFSGDAPLAVDRRRSGPRFSRPAPLTKKSAHARESVLAVREHLARPILAGPDPWPTAAQWVPPNVSDRFAGR